MCTQRLQGKRSELLMEQVLETQEFSYQCPPSVASQPVGGDPHRIAFPQQAFSDLQEGDGPQFVGSRQGEDAVEARVRTQRG